MPTRETYKDEIDREYAVARARGMTVQQARNEARDVVYAQAGIQQRYSKMQLEEYANTKST